MLNDFFCWLSCRYHYRLLSGPEPPSVFEKNSAWHIPQDLDIEAMKVKPLTVFYLLANVKLCLH
jgi:tRNA U38,U39,U40 pseudouridine synthase TruA